ncbi:hypothetical protein LCGC14_1891120 [marine sediment metagenome]|uniref:Uncharacterized protein n=1 Tax=marine sediment metagenome TaxID=412755 RepID=A0A0F9IDD2_9ZZZZ
MDMKKEFLTRLGDYKVISIIGLAKNVSKTTTLNYIIKNLEGYKLGLTSIGRDGEKYDVITQLPKPRIFIKIGTIIATARQSYEASEVKMEILKKTEFNTPLGEILILRALNEGFIELAGPSINRHLQEICLELKNLGCDLILIDGAFDRRSYATPIISDATILSTGASVSRNMGKVIDLTSHIYNLFSLEIVKDDKIRKISKDILLTAQVGIINDDHSSNKLENSTALGSSKAIFDQLTKDAKYLVIKGAITDNFLDEYGINKKVKDITIITTDPTKLFISKQVFYKFIKKGGRLKVLDRINLIAITINPTSPLGHEFEENQFMRLLQERISIPIFNLGTCDNL